MQWLLLFLFVVFLSPAHAESQEVKDLIAKVLARDELQQADLAHFSYHQKVRTEKIDPATGKVKSDSMLEMEVRPGENDFTIVSNGSGNALTPAQVSKSDRKAARDSEKLKASFSLRRLATHFNIEIVDHETLAGIPCTVVAFTPRPGQPYSSRIEKVLNNLSGRMWITDTNSILQTKATLAKPVQMAWVFASMTNLTFYFRAAPIEGGYGPAEFDLDFQVDVMTHQIHQRQLISMDHYRRQ